MQSKGLLGSCGLDGSVNLEIFKSKNHRFVLGKSGFGGAVTGGREDIVEVVEDNADQVVDVVMDWVGRI